MDLKSWVDFLKIPNFRGVFSRDEAHFYEEGCCILNLDDKVGPGTHWVAIFVGESGFYYFDSFSLPPPIEFINFANKLKKRITYNYGYPIQDLKSVRCGYYCLYFLDNIWRKSFYDVLKVFDLGKTQNNEDFIKKLLFFLK